MAFSIRRSVFALAIFSAMPLLVACPKKDPPAPDAAPPPPPPPPEVDSSTVLVPLDEGDAAADADADAKKPTGPYVPTNVARLRQCCNQLSITAKGLGASPEAGMLLGAAAQCNAMAAGVAPNSNVPEMGTIRNLLQGRNVPAACAGF